ncbi:MAG: 4Fe-4S ferredoxin [Gammaproteobacteria bacterium]|jgi:epoxyqueuosine reductase QueG|nr:4Fe-4S ferredoxin [Gammaproteobacteria bacterium]|tara:strand:+ start:516 stop:1589 length:1074 start_codon:yes stop_codon:yes gene_type:complete
MFKKEMSKEELTQLAVAYLKEQGACEVGVVTKETLAGGPPSTNLEYVLADAASALSFAVPLDEEKISSFLGKKDHAGHQEDNIHTGFFITGLAVGLASYLDQIGYPSYGVDSNIVYRKDTPRGSRDFKPDISHRYLAARSGVGWLGFSGNIITPSHGASVLLGSVVTTAELEPTDPLPEDKKYCDECRLCYAACTSHLMDKEEQSTVTMGGIEFSYQKRRSYHRCDLVCGGFTGLSEKGKWSTWSPGRFPIPDDDIEFRGALMEATQAWLKRPAIEDGGFRHPQSPGGRKLNFTCGNCQLVCHPDKNERNRRFKLLSGGGVVIQHADGNIEAVKPDKAREHLDALDDEQRALYERIC